MGVGDGIGENTVGSKGGRGVESGSTGENEDRQKSGD